MTPAPRRCSRCGAEVPAILDLAMVAKRADKALRTMRIAIPDEATKGVRTLASALPCYAGTCSPEDRR
jgi:hypothetical protein